MEKFDDDPYTDAQHAQTLRAQITAYAAEAVKYAGIDRDWVNGRLTAMGAEPIVGHADYKINVPITGLFGLTIKAKSRTEAAEKFNGIVKNIVADGQLNCGRVFQPAVQGDLEFFSGPEDPEQPDGNAPTLDAQGVRDAIRAMLKEGVSVYGWGHSYAQQALEDMGIDKLPPLQHRPVEVEVSGTAKLQVRVFEGDDDDEAQKVAAAVVRRSRTLVVTPDEVGPIVADRSALAETMGLTVVDDDEEEPF